MVYSPTSTFLSAITFKRNFRINDKVILIWRDPKGGVRKARALTGEGGISQPGNPPPPEKDIPFPEGNLYWKVELI